MKNLLACLLWATCLLPNLAYAQINPKDLVGFWLLEKIDTTNAEPKGYFIFHENGFLEFTVDIRFTPRISKWHIDNDSLVFREYADQEYRSSRKMLELTDKSFILNSYGKIFTYRKITREELTAYMNSPEAKATLDADKKSQKEQLESQMQQYKAKRKPFVGTWTLQDKKRKVTLILKDDGRLSYQIDKEIVEGGWYVYDGIFDVKLFDIKGNLQFGGLYKLQIISQTDKELKTKDFLTQTVLVWRR